MSAGPLVVTYPLTGRGRAIVAEEPGEAAEAIYLVDLAPAGRAAARGRAGAVLSHGRSKDCGPMSSRSSAMLGCCNSPPPASIGCRPATCRGNCRSPPIRAEAPNRCRSTSSHWRWLRRGACSSRGMAEITVAPDFRPLAGKEAQSGILSERADLAQQHLVVGQAEDLPTRRRSHRKRSAIPVLRGLRADERSCLIRARQGG